MKTYRRFFLTALLLLGLGLMLCACSGEGTPDETGDTGDSVIGEGSAEDPAGSISAITVCGVDYTDTVLDEGDSKRWANENDLDNEACSMPGIIVSPYFSMTANGVDIPVFAERTANGPHNLAYIEVDGVGEDGVFSLNVELEAHTARKDPVVLPESSGVTAVSDGKKTTARITSFGSYTFTFDKGLLNDGSELPLTVMVKPKELSEYKNYKTREIEPGTYPLGELDLSTPGSLYYFKKGVYEIDCINIATGNIIVYFEPGTLLVAKPLTLDENGTPMAQHVIAGWGQFGVKILGHAAVDLSYRPRTGVIFSFDKMSLLEFGGTQCHQFQQLDVLLYRM